MKLSPSKENKQSQNSYKRNADLSVNIIFYCSLTDKKLHKRDINAGTDVAMAWPISSLECSGRSLIYTGTNSLIFPYYRNGLYGVAEYLNP